MPRMSGKTSKIVEVNSCDLSYIGIFKNLADAGKSWEDMTYRSVNH